MKGSSSSFELYHFRGHVLSAGCIEVRGLEITECVGRFRTHRMGPRHSLACNLCFQSLALQFFIIVYSLQWTLRDSELVRGS